MRTLLMRGSLLGLLPALTGISAAVADAEVASVGPNASSSLRYSCPTEFGEFDFTAVISTDLPDTVEPETRLTPVFSSQVSVHPDVASQIRAAGYSSVSGTGTLAVTTDGFRSDASLQAPTQEVGTPFFLFLGGQSASAVTAESPGEIRLLAGSLTISLIFSDSSAQTHSASWACTLAANQNAVIDVVTVAAPQRGNEPETPENPPAEPDDPEDSAEPTEPEVDDETTETPVQINVPAMVRAGERLVVQFPGKFAGETFDFDIRAHDQSISVPIGAARVNEDGRASLTIPASMNEGVHTLGVLRDGEVIASAEVEIVAIEQRGWTAPLTSATPTSGNTAWAVVAVGLGAALVTAAMVFRRRATARVGHRARGQSRGKRVA